MESKVLFVYLALVLISISLVAAAENGGSKADKRAARRSRYERWRRQHCTNCTVKGREYQGHSRFRYDEECFRFRCMCRCDGSWECPPERTINMCERRQAAKRRWRNQAKNKKASQSKRHRQCQKCKVNGKEYPGHAYFRHADGCTTYDRCTCYCNGTWVCPASRARNTCKDETTSAASTTTTTTAAPTTTTTTTAAPTTISTTTAPTTTTTTAAKITTTTTTTTSTKSRAIPRIQNTTSASIKSDLRKSEPSSSKSSGGGRTRRQYGRCQSCNAFGKTYQGNSYFHAQLGCTNYTRCLCKCDGSWNCFARFSRSICPETTVAATTMRCTSCSVKGQTFPGGQNFTHTDKCIEYSQCVCNCDGSWSCPGSTARNVCTAKTEESTAEDKGCNMCTVYGDKFEGGKNFTITRGCWEFRNCMCHCNGSWVCPPSSSRNLCKTAKEAQPPECKTCEAYGKFFTNQSFDVTDGCLEYKYCTCRCNGYWECKEENAINICKVEPNNTSTIAPRRRCSECDAKGKKVPGGSEFELTDGCSHYTACSCDCDGSWNCPSENYRNICSEAGDSRDVSGCMKCKTTDGKFHHPNRPFQFIDDCIERNCDCFCNGSWSCPGDRSRWICTDRCRGCDVEGRQVHNNTVFKHRTGCLEYICNCHCNGSWSCPGETVKNTCPIGVRDNCNKCKISSTEEYPGESDFVLKQGCLHYKCRCNCDGSYNCPAEDSRNICYGEELGGCRSCVVSPNEIYQGGSDFNLRRECIASECKCYCNGTWQCPVEKNRNVCLGEALGGCKVCQANNQTFRGNSDFEFRKECLHYKCRCNCDGSWNCPGEQTRNLCKGEVPGGCRSCVLSEDEFYPGESNFEMVKNCIHYKCRCSCDGSYNCPGEKARRVCVVGPNGEKRPVNQRNGRRQCRQCQVSERQKFEGNSTFFMTEGCFKYQCTCNCDGSYQCPAERSINVCKDTYERRNQKAQVPRQCRKCLANGAEYAGGSDFSFTRDCFKYMCSCKCDGSYNCPPEKTIDICRKTGSATESKKPRKASCRRCRISDQQVFEGDSEFSLQFGCSKYTCSCACDGSWDCPASTKVDTCGEGQERQEARKGSTRTRTCEVCRRDGREFTAGSNYKITRGCHQFDCTCQCDGTSSCDLNKPTNICSTRKRNRSKDNGLRRTNYKNYLAENTRNKDRCKPCDVIGQQVSPGQEFYLERECTRYISCQCRCNGHWQCAKRENICPQGKVSRNEKVVVKRFEGTSSISLTPTASQETINRQNSGEGSRKIESSAWVYVDGDDSSFVKVEDEDKTGGGYKIEVKTKYAPSFGKGNSRNVAEIKEKSSKVYTASGSTPGNESFIQHEVETGGSQKPTGKGISRCNKCIVDTKQYPSGAHFDKRRGCVVYKCLCLCSGSYRCRVTADNECTDEKQKSSCSNCNYNGMIFPGNMGFTVREGCLERHCSCLCNGTYVCPTSKPLPGCSASSQTSAGQRGLGSFYAIQRYIPASVGYVRRTGDPVYTHCPSCGSGTPVVYHNPVRRVDQQPDRTSGEETGRQAEKCSGCQVEGTYRAGGTTFTFKKDCVEFDCYCSCGGSWKCSGQPVNCSRDNDVRSRAQDGKHFDPAPERLTRIRGNVKRHAAAAATDDYRPADRDDYRTSERDGYRPADRDDYRTDVRDDYRPADRDDYRTSERDGYRTAERDGYSTIDRDGYRPVDRDGYRTADRDSYRPADRDGYRPSQRDDQRTADRDGLRSADRDEYRPADKDDYRYAGRGEYMDDRDVYRTGKRDSRGDYRTADRDDYRPTHREDYRDFRSSDSRPYVQSAPAVAPKELVRQKRQPRACVNCNVDGQTVQPDTNFVRREGCFETVCRCHCDGRHVCPRGMAVNVCQLEGTKSTEERKGCRVGNKVYLTREFYLVESCIQRTCTCRDDGTYTCTRNDDDIVVC